MRPRWREFLVTFALADGLETNLDKWKWQVFFLVRANVRSAPEACRHTICPHYTYLTTHRQPV